MERTCLAQPAMVPCPSILPGSVTGAITLQVLLRLTAVYL